MKYLQILSRWLRWLEPSAKRYGYAKVEDPPSEVDDGIVYLIGDGAVPWSASFICPCGCKAVISLSLVKDDSPRWEARISDNLISLHPSVWRKKGCGSHFYIRSGRVLWAKEESPKCTR